MWQGKNSSAVGAADASGGDGYDLQKLSSFHGEAKAGSRKSLYGRAEARPSE
jgi:hypothetical protein